MDSIGGLFGGAPSGGVGGGITYPPPSSTGAFDQLTGMPGVPATPDVMPGMSTVMPAAEETAAAGAAGPTAAGGGGIGDILAKAGKLGGAGLGLASLFKKSPTDIVSKDLSKLAKTGTSAGNTLLGQYTSAQLSGPEQAQIDAWKKAQMARLMQEYSSMGIPTSSMTAQAQAWVDQQAQVMVNDMLQRKFGNSMQALGLTQNALANQARIAMMQDQEALKQWGDMGKNISELATLLE